MSPKAGSFNPPAVKEAPKEKAPKKETKRASKDDPIGDDPAMFWSDNTDCQQEVIIVYGQIGSGKTYASHSASAFWPKSLPAGKLVTLRDVFTLQTDRHATAGMRGDNIRVATFDPLYFRAHEKVWSAFFRNSPTWIQAMEIGIKKAYEHCERCDREGLRPILIVDSLTGFDTEQMRRAKEVALAEDGGKNKYLHFAIHGEWHTNFFSDLLGTGADIILNCHQRESRADTAGAKDKVIVVRVAGNMSNFEPDLQGKIAPKMYKRHMTLQLLIQAHTRKVAGKNEIRREMLVGVNDTGAEMKNRYERALASLNGSMSPPDLHKLLEMVRR